jgi:ATP-dependent DNA helicase DinG
LLPACNTVILDESAPAFRHGHALLRRGAHFRQLAELARDSEVAARAGAREVRSCPRPRNGIAPATRKLRLALGDLPAKITQQAAIGKEGFSAALDELTAALDRLDAELGLFAERSEDIAHCAERARAAATQLARWRAGLAASADPTSAGDAAWIRWVDVTQTGLAAPRVAAVDRRRFRQARRRVGTRVDLHVGDARRRQGFFSVPARARASRTRHRLLGIAVRLRRPGLLVRARDLPQPNSREHTEAVVAASLPVLRASGGRAFLLFTTLRALNIARELLAAALARESSTGRCWCRAKGRGSELLTRFRELGNAILLGSASFREGVDVPGSALSVVILDKLPFAPPDDPLLAARLELLRAEGGNPFFDYQVPQAAIA